MSDPAAQLAAKPKHFCVPLGSQSNLELSADDAIRLVQLIDATLLAPFERPIPLRPFWWRR